MGTREVKLYIHRSRQSVITLGLVCAQVFEHDVNMAPRRRGDHAIHEVEILDPTSMLAMPGIRQPGGDLRGRKQGCCGMALVVVIESGQGATVGGLERALCPFQSPNVRPLIGEQRDGVHGRIQIQADDIAWLLRRLRVPAYTSTPPTFGRDLVLSEHASDVMLRDALEIVGWRRAISAGIVGGWRVVPGLENAPIRVRIVEGWLVAARRIRETRYPRRRKPPTPLVGRCQLCAPSHVDLLFVQRTSQARDHMHLKRRALLRRVCRHRTLKRRPVGVRAQDVHSLNPATTPWSLNFAMRPWLRYAREDVVFPSRPAMPPDSQVAFRHSVSGPISW